MRTAKDVIRVKADTKDRFVNFVGNDMTADIALTKLLDQFPDLVPMEYELPTWVLDRYERVANAVHIDVSKLLNAALLMGLFREWDQLSDLELLNRGK